MPRPAIPIPAKEVYRLAKDGAKNTEIAEYFGVSPDTIERRFAGELRKGRAARNVSLRRLQLRAAEQGNATMLIWLGKQYLDQSDSLIDQYLLDAIKTAGLTKEDLVTLIQKKDAINAGKPKVSYPEFCRKAGYPDPFEKQIEMMEFGINGKVPRMILGSRGYGKTDYVTLLGVAYAVYLRGTEISFLILSKSKTRNTAMIGEIAKALTLNGVSLETENSTCVRVSGRTGKDHSVEVLTVGSSFRGRHPDVIVMDDPVTEEDVSEATRALVERKYNEAFKLCPNIVIIGQPAHKFDLYAKLRKLLKLMELPHGTIPELDHDLEAQRLAGVDEASIQASYFLKILNEGTTPFDTIRYLDKFPTGDAAVAFIDPSHEGGDYTALTILKAHMQGVAVVGFAWKKAWNHCLDDMVDPLKKFGVQKLAFETNALGDMPITILRQTFPGLGVVGRRSNTNKHSRILAAGAYAHLIHLSRESSRQYIDQVVQYEYKAKFDDAPDSLASALEWVGLIRGKR